MKNILTIACTLLFILGISTYAQEKPEKAPEKKMEKMEMKKDVEKSSSKIETKEGSEKVKVANIVCPVSGEDIEDHDHLVTYAGKTFALCCNKCVAKFEKDPEKYVSKLADDGKSLNKPSKKN